MYDLRRSLSDGRGYAHMDEGKYVQRRRAHTCGRALTLSLTCARSQSVKGSCWFGVGRVGRRVCLVVEHEDHSTHVTWQRTPSHRQAQPHSHGLTCGGGGGVEK